MEDVRTLVCPVCGEIIVVEKEEIKDIDFYQCYECGIFIEVK